MPDLISPIDGQPWPQADYYDDAPLWSPSGVAGTPQSSASAGDLGITFNGLAFTLALGRARVRGMRYRRSTTAASGTIPANTNTTLDRRDRLVLRRDLAAQTCTPVLLQGTPAASPLAPALTQVDDGVWDVPLFSWTTPKNSGTVVTSVLDERVWINPNGGRLRGLYLTGTSAFTVTNSAWTISNATLQQVAQGVAQIYLELTRASGAATITPDATGDISNSDIGQITAGYEPAIPVTLCSGATGRSAFGYLTTAGVLGLSALTGTSGLTAGQTISLGATFGLAAN